MLIGDLGTEWLADPWLMDCSETGCASLRMRDKVVLFNAQGKRDVGYGHLGETTSGAILNLFSLTDGGVVFRLC